MTTTIASPQARRGSSAPAAARALLAAAPLAALLAGMGAQWLDFRELRVVFLLGVGVAVLLSARAASGTGAGRRPFALALALGMATWAAAETVYVLLHVGLGQQFQADRFGPQWSQALGLIAVHAIFLGLPTGLAATVILHAGAWWRGRRA